MKKKKVKLDLKKHTVSGFNKRNVLGGTILSQYPDAQSECLCGPRKTIDGCPDPTEFTCKTQVEGDPWCDSELCNPF